MRTTRRALQHVKILDTGIFHVQMTSTDKLAPLSHHLFDWAVCLAGRLTVVGAKARRRIGTSDVARVKRIPALGRAKPFGKRAVQSVDHFGTFVHALQLRAGFGHVRYRVAYCLAFVSPTEVTDKRL